MHAHLHAPLALSDEGEELSTNHQIYLHAGPFLLVSALHTSSIIAHNLI